MREGEEEERESLVVAEEEEVAAMVAEGRKREAAPVREEAMVGEGEDAEIRVLVAIG